MSNTNSQLDGLGSFNQLAQNAGTIKYGAFLNAAKNLGTIALSATFGNTSVNLGTIGDVIPIITASLVQQNSANWDTAYTAVISNSAIWALSGGSGTGDAANAPIWDAVASYVQSISSSLSSTGSEDFSKFLTSDGAYYAKWNSTFNTMSANSAAWMNSDTTNAESWDAAASFVNSNSASLVYTNDSRLADSPNGNSAYSYLQSNSANFIIEGDSRLSDSRTPVAHTHDASAIVSGKIDVARLPVVPSQEQVLISGVMYTSGGLYTGGVDHFYYSLSAINQGTIVTTTDGYRWVYTGAGDKRYGTSYVLLADITPEWSAIANKPVSFPVDLHTHEISAVNGLQSSLNTLQSNIDGKQASGNYALATDPRFTVLATNSAQWGGGTEQGYSAYTYVQANSASLVFTNDSRLTNSRTPTAHTHGISEVAGLGTILSGKTDVTDFEELYTFVGENSGTWQGVSVVYNHFKTTSAAAVYSDDVRLARANTSYSYLTGASAGFVNTSDARLSNASTAYSYVTANSASIVLTSDSRLTNAATTQTLIAANSASWIAGSAGSINYTIDGGGVAITTGSKGFVQIPTNFTVQEWHIVADIQTTTFIVDVRKASFADFPTTAGILGTDFLTLSNQQKNRNLSASWTNISAGELLEFYVTTASNASMINISLKGIRS
jgi:hypothetical protein